jgi:hypothetical protein
MDINGLSFDTASFFVVKLIFAVVCFGIVCFVFLVGRQVQLMNRVLHTSLASLFSVIALVMMLFALGLFVLSLLALFV